MKSRWISRRRRQVSKQALTVLRVSLAAVFLTLGWGFACFPGVARDMEQAGIERESRLILAAAHFAGGLALLIPGMAGQAALVLGIGVAATAVYLRVEGVSQSDLAPGVLISILIAFVVGLKIRERVDASRWREMLARYADQQDSLRSENA